MLGVLIGAFVLGAIICAMEGDFPDLFPLAGCVVGTSLAGLLTRLLLVDLNAAWTPFLALFVSALACVVLVSWLLGMELKRALTAASIYFGVQMAIATGFQLILGG